MSESPKNKYAGNIFILYGTKNSDQKLTYGLDIYPKGVDFIEYYNQHPDIELAWLGEGASAYESFSKRLAKLNQGVALEDIKAYQVPSGLYMVPELAPRTEEKRVNLTMQLDRSDNIIDFVDSYEGKIMNLPLFTTLEEAFECERSKNVALYEEGHFYYKFNPDFNVEEELEKVNPLHEKATENNLTEQLISAFAYKSNQIKNHPEQLDIHSPNESEIKTEMEQILLMEKSKEYDPQKTPKISLEEFNETSILYRDNQEISRVYKTVNELLNTPEMESKIINLAISKQIKDPDYQSRKQEVLDECSNTVKQITNKLTSDLESKYQNIKHQQIELESEFVKQEFPADEINDFQKYQPLNKKETAIIQNQLENKAEEWLIKQVAIQEQSIYDYICPEIVALASDINEKNDDFEVVIESQDNELFCTVFDVMTEEERNYVVGKDDSYDFTIKTYDALSDLGFFLSDVKSEIIDESIIEENQYYLNQSGLEL